MNRKGFTLVELLATLVLLAIISTISYVSINAVIEKNKDNNCETLKNNIISAVKMYVSDNRYEGNLEIDENGMIDVKTLTDNNYLTNYSGDKKLTITVELDNMKNVINVGLPDGICEK